MAGTGDAQTLKQLVLGRQDAQDLSDTEQELPPDLMTVNMGPSHPAMHGTVRIVLTVDGEKIIKGDVQPGYLHRCFEKESEHATYTQVFPYTDRLNYVSPMINNCGWAMAVEKLLGLTTKIPRRAEYIRVIVSEMSRITDHLTCVGASAMELGAFTPFLYLLKAREWMYELLEKVSGARLTHSYVRVGGVSKDLPDNFAHELSDVPLGTTGDCYDRYLIRLEELKQSMRMLRQCLVQLPEGPVMSDDHRVALPAKQATYNTIESMIRHFKHIMDGVRVPAGEAYSFVEGGNGELGFFIVADGTGRPYKAYCRSPSFVHLSTAEMLIKDHFIADVVPIFGMINMIGGECDK
jgi:NADH:ubiquinone oxidoreductase subunit D